MLDICGALGWSLARWHEIARDEQVRWIAWWRVKHVPPAEAKPAKAPRAVKSPRGG